ncbi:hypothetical protein, partial [Rubrivirga sp.]|uniref:hypothetical protein n=1 Tax=Rubrivirga sp. TaxID=1885344 RepID=UPI003C7261B2
MKRLLALALAGGLAVSGLTAFTPTAPVPNDVLVLEGASHSVTIEYLERRGDYRRANVTVQPVRRGDRPAWSGEARSFRLVGNGTLSRADRSRFSRAGISTTQILSSGFGSNVVMVAPSPQTLVGIAVTPARGRTVGFAIPPMSSRGGDGDTDEPPPE